MVLQSLIDLTRFGAIAFITSLGISLLLVI
jgi:hypothetical protein